MDKPIANKFVNDTFYNSLPYADDVEPVGANDMACLAEIRDVLERHDMLARFGVTLLHKHFDLAEGETLVETTDETGRTQTIAPVTAAARAQSQVLQTQFSLQTGEAVASCLLECVISNNSHSSKHATFGG